MGMFDFLTRIGKEQRTMLYFKENGNFKFQKMEVEDTFLLEKKDGRVVRAWKNFYKLQIPFYGFKSIRRDMVTIGFARDIIYDPFKFLSNEEKPKIIQDYIADVVNGQRHKRQEQASKKMAFTTQVALFGIPVVLLWIAVFIIIMVNVRH